MAGTRTAPTVSGTPTFIEVTLRWMDYTSDLRSDTYLVDTVAATPANIEAFGAAAQAISNSTLYRIDASDVYNSVPDSQNALEEVWENVKDNLVLQTKNAMKQSLRAFIPSPVESMFIDGTETIDPTSVDLNTFIASYVALIPAGYDVVGARFTHRKQINQQVKF